MTSTPEMAHPIVVGTDQTRICTGGMGVLAMRVAT